MRQLAALLGAFVLGLIHIPASSAATVISSGSFAANSGVLAIELGSEPAYGEHVHYELNFSQPVNFLGGLYEDTSYISYYNFSGNGLQPEGSGDVPKIASFVEITPMHYTLDFEYTTPPDAYVQIGAYEYFYRYSTACCTFNTEYFYAPWSGTYTLTASGAPEPEAWALMICGLGAIGVAMRREKQRQRNPYAEPRARTSKSLGSGPNNGIPSATGS